MSSAMKYVEFMEQLRDGLVTVQQDYEDAPNILIVTHSDGTQYRLNMRYLDKHAFTQMLIYADERSKS